MRISVLSCFLLLLVLACKNPRKTATASFLHSFVDTLKVDRSKNILIYTINPNDCISCMNGFKTMDADFSESPNSCIYVILIEREIEKNEWLKKTKILNLNKGSNKIVLWDKSVFTKINASLNKNNLLSLVCIYNYQRDSVVYSSPIKDVVDESLFEQNLNN
ncbi:hypothetical protein BH10BAC1_BH10BAC1_18410 [soil metagenome]